MTQRSRIIRNGRDDRERRARREAERRGHDPGGRPDDESYFINIVADSWSPSRSGADASDADVASALLDVFGWTEESAEAVARVRDPLVGRLSRTWGGHGAPVTFRILRDIADDVEVIRRHLDDGEQHVRAPLKQALLAQFMRELEPHKPAVEALGLTILRVSIEETTPAGKGWRKAVDEWPFKTPEQRIRAVIERLNAQHDVGLSFGYVGNVSVGYDDRAWSVFSKIPPDNERIGTMSFGSARSGDLERLAEQVESGALERWVVERLVPRMARRWRGFDVRSRTREHWGPIETALTRMGASFGSQGGGRWSFSIIGASLDDIARTLAAYDAEVSLRAY